MGTEDEPPERVGDHADVGEYLRRRRALLPASIGGDGSSDELPAVADPAVPTVPTRPLSSPKDGSMLTAAPTTEGGAGPRRHVSGRTVAKGFVRMLIGAVAGWLLVGQVLSGGHSDRPAGGEDQGVSEFSTHGVSFRYPSALQRLTPDEVANIDWGEGVEGFADPWAEVLALDDVNLIVVTPDPLPVVIDRTNLAAFSARSAKSRLIAATSVEVDTTTVQTLPAFRIRYEVPGGMGGPDLEKVVTEVFVGSLGYLVSCQWSAQHRIDMAEACDQVVRTFSPPRDAPDDGWRAIEPVFATMTLSLPPGWEAPPRTGATLGVLRIPGQRGRAADVGLSSSALPANVSTSRGFAEYFARTTGIDVSRSEAIDLPVGSVQVLTGRARGVSVVVYGLVEGRSGYALVFRTPGARADVTFLRPTMDAIARTIELSSKQIA